MATEQFLSTLFRNKPEDDYILIWKKHLPDHTGQELKTSAWFKSIDDAVKYCQQNGQPADIYVGCGTSPKNFGEKRRCLASEIAGIPAVWLDIDILDPAHKKPNLPESETKAQELINAFPLHPTMIIHSGHGYQCWWIFEQFLSFQNKMDLREEASNFVHQFIWSMRDLARSMGYDLDMTFDLARVMRVPGSLNLKDPENPKPVKLSYISDSFFNHVEFKQALDQFINDLGTKATPIEPLGKRVTSNQLVVGEKITLDPNAEPPRMKFEALYEIDAKFASSWNRTRKDFLDPSPSSYDMSLASMALYNEWTTQEAVDLMIAWRRKHGCDLKLREDYYLRTIIKASNVLDKKRAIDELANLSIESELTGLPYNNEQLLSAKDFLSTRAGVKINRILKYLFDPPEYKLETALGCIHLGQIKNLIEQYYFRQKLSDATKVLIPEMKKKEWQIFAENLLKACEDIKISDDTDNKGILKSWLIKYLQFQEPSYDGNDVWLLMKPFFEDKYLYIFMSNFKDFIAVHCKEKKNEKEMGLLLRDFGFRPAKRNFKDDTRYHCRSVWRLNLAVDPDINSFVDQALLDEKNRLALEYKMEVTAKRKEYEGPDDY